MTEKKIQKHLLSKYKSHKYVFLNTYYFDSECDWVSILASGYSWEIEIKVTKSDYKADFKKKKHKWMQATYADSNHRMAKHTPNRFYFCVPNGLVDKSEVPEYAGLIEIDDKNKFRVVKNAPILHHNKDDVQKRMFNRLYHRYMNSLVEALFNL